MPQPAHLATVWRGDVAEAVIRGHVAVARADGTVEWAAGDARAITTLRSCVKPIQAQPFVAHALDRIGATEAELAVACASHDGDDVHVETVRSLLARAGVPEQALACGPQLPGNIASAQRLLAAGGAPLPVHNNCSGKHAGMLATCTVMGWPLAGYLDAEHPCQQAIAAALRSLLAIDLATTPWGVDGCGLPTYGVELATLARGFAAGLTDSGFQRCQAAMAARPELVAGEGRFDTALLRASGASITAKSGGAAVWAAALGDTGVGVAIKLEAGDATALAPVALAVLQALGAVPASLPEGLEPFAAPPVRNWAGRLVGAVRVEPNALDDLGRGAL